MRRPDAQDKVRVFLKGAPEIVMKYCDKILDSNGQASQLSESKKEEIMNEVVA